MRIEKPTPWILACLMLGVLLAAGPGSVLADETPEAAAPSTEATGAEAAEPRPLPFDPADFHLLPLDDIERAELFSESPQLVGRLTQLGRQVDRLQKELDARKNPADARSNQVRARLLELKAEVADVMGRALPVLEPHGVTPRVLALVAGAPDEPDRKVRSDLYARRLVLALEDLRPEQRALFERLVPGVEAAQAALRAQARRLRRTLEQVEVDAAGKQAAVAQVNRQMYFMDRYYWRVVDATLDLDQRATLHEWMPHSHARKDTAIEHLYTLPDLTPAQGMQIRSLVTEIEAENAPDVALVARLQAELKGQDVAGPERQAKQAEIRDAQRRQQALLRWSRDKLTEILSEEQLHFYKGIPPRVNVYDRRQNSRRVLDGIPMDADQKLAFGEVLASLREEQRALQAKVREIQKERQAYGPDSPQMAMMEMMGAAAQAEGAELTRRALGAVFLQILSPDQVVAYVTGWTGKMR